MNHENNACVFRCHPNFHHYRPTPSSKKREKRGKQMIPEALNDNTAIFELETSLSRLFNSNKYATIPHPAEMKGNRLESEHDGSKLFRTSFSLRRKKREKRDERNPPLPVPRSFFKRGLFTPFFFSSPPTVTTTANSGWGQHCVVRFSRTSKLSTVGQIFVVSIINGGGIIIISREDDQGAVIDRGFGLGGGDRGHRPRQGPGQ